MKAGDVLPTSTASTVKQVEFNSPAASLSILGGGSYKLVSLAAVLLLAIYSMLAGSAYLRQYAAASVIPAADSPFLINLDALVLSVHRSPFPTVRFLNPLDVVQEMEEREKAVRRMWEVYAGVLRAPLPRFWRDAFEAAFEDLAGEDRGARDAAVAEIARMTAPGLRDLEAQRD